MRLIHPVAVLAVAATLSLAVGPQRRAVADSDHDAARGAVERGEIRPLAEILAVVRGRLPGEVVGVEIERKRGRWLYEFRVVDPNGRIYEVYVDGNSGAVERVKEK